MESIKCELKYCEGCGTLKLRPINSDTNDCVVCERMLARFRFPRALLARTNSNNVSAAIRRIVPQAACSALPVGVTQ